jgi:hypothetical protein
MIRAAIEFRPSSTCRPAPSCAILPLIFFSLQESLHALEHDLFVFDDVKQLKGWLKSVKRSLATPRFGDMLF